jgi:AcrR family transcriptional regulator
MWVYPAVMSPPSGLRERKKQRTRETIARAAHELFVERGYQATTLPDIAQAADVATRTIFAYFPSKDDILFSEISAMKEALERALSERLVGRDALEIVRTFIVSTQLEGTSPLLEKIHQLIKTDPTLRNQLRARITQMEDIIAPAIAADLGTRADDPGTQLVTASLIAGFNLLADRGTAKDDALTPQEITAVIDPVFTFLRAGLEALKDRRPVRRRRTTA